MVEGNFYCTWGLEINTTAIETFFVSIITTLGTHWRASRHCVAYTEQRHQGVCKNVWETNHIFHESFFCMQQAFYRTLGEQPTPNPPGFDASVLSPALCLHVHLWLWLCVPFGSPAQVGMREFNPRIWGGHKN